MSDGSLRNMDTVSVKLSDANKRTLLDGVNLRATQRQSEADTMLCRLRELNREMAAQFELKRSALEKLTLRMICSMDADRTRDPNASVLSYLAVSYCWHNESWQAAEAAKPLSEWGLSQPMADKILSLRDSKDEGVWVDQVCIKQCDNDEKKITIGLMDVIYRACRRLIILLEDVQLSKAQEAVGLEYAMLYESMCLEMRGKQLSGAEKSSFVDAYWRLNVPDIPTATAMEFIMKMLGARWYSRAWCAHESRVNEHGKDQNPLFLCFNADGLVISFEFRFIFFLAVYLVKSASNATPNKLSNGMRVFAAPDGIPCTTLFQRMVRMQKMLPRRDSQITLLHHLTTISTFGCEKVTDFCTIAMNTAGIPLVFTGTVQSREHIHYIFSLLVLASGDVGSLLIQGQKIQSKDSSGKVFISWAEQPSHCGPEELRLGTPIPQSISSVTAEYIQLDLLLIKARPMKVSEESIHKAKLILEKCASKGKDSMRRVEHSSYTDPIIKFAVGVINKSDYRSMWTWRTELLGSALECGINWIRRLPGVLETETKSGTWAHGKFDDFDLSFTDAATDLLFHFGITQANSIEFNNKFLHPTIRFLTYFTDDRLLLISAMVLRAIPTKAAGDFAITAQISNRSWIVIPQAVSHLPFFYNRAWVVEPYDTAAPEKDIRTFLKTSSELANLENLENAFPVLTSDYEDLRDPPNGQQTWMIRNRQPLFGSQAIVEDGEAVVLLKNQIVYGGKDYDWAALK
jgi:Heterokaryon incompatibility protein (HET)